MYGIILKYTGYTGFGFGVLWWCCLLRCVVLCARVVAPLTGLSCMARVSSYFLQFRFIALSFRVRLNSAAARLQGCAHFSFGFSSKLATKVVGGGLHYHGASSSVGRGDGVNVCGTV